MNSVVSIIGYIFCIMFLGSLVVLVMMMCINEFRRFFDSNKKKSKSISKDVDSLES